MSHLRSFLRSFHVNAHCTKKGTVVSIAVISICTLASATFVVAGEPFTNNTNTLVVQASEGYRDKQVGEESAVTAILLSEKKSEITPDNQGNSLLNLDMATQGDKITSVQWIQVKEKQEAIKEAREAENAIKCTQARENANIQRELILQQVRDAAERAEAAEQARIKAGKQAAAKQKAANKKINLSKTDRKVLEKIIEAEAGDQDLKGRILVGNVVMNRVKNKEFPSSVKGVVYEHSGSCYQFSPVLDGAINRVKVSKTTKQAVDKVVSGVDYSKGALYFIQRDIAGKKGLNWFDRALTRLFKHGCHTFYK